MRGKIMSESLRIIKLESASGFKHPSMFDVTKKFIELQDTYEHVSFKQIIMNYDNVYPNYLVVMTD